MEPFNFVKLFTCSLCEKFFENPVVLPCGASICKQHVSQNKISKNDSEDTIDSVDDDDDETERSSSIDFEYECGLCHSNHSVPEDGFPSNIYITAFFQLNLHLNKKAIEELELIKQLDLSINELRVLNNDPDNFVFDYVSTIINKIDSERERLIAKLHEVSSVMINKLNSFREECKANFKNFEGLINENKSIITNLEQKSKKLKKKLRKPQLDQNLADEMIKETKTSLDENKTRCSELKTKALNGKEWLFYPKYFQFTSENFGVFKFEDKFNVTEVATIKFVINEFSTFKKNKSSLVSPSRIVANLPWQIEAKKQKSLIHPSKSDFGFSLITTDRSTDWSAVVDFEFRLLHNAQHNLIRKSQSLFNSVNSSWGFQSFITMDKLLNPQQGYIKNDSITLEVWLKVNKKINQTVAVEDDSTSTVDGDISDYTTSEDGTNSDYD